jgi:hypothetical protein
VLASYRPWNARFAKIHFRIRFIPGGRAGAGEQTPHLRFLSDIHRGVLQSTAHCATQAIEQDHQPGAATGDIVLIRC